MRALVNWLKNNTRVFKRVGFEAIFPLIVGIVWGFVCYVYSKMESVASISLGAGAFFFAFSMQSWLLRAAKNVRDEDTRSEVISIREGVEQLLSQGAVLPPPPGPAHPCDFRVEFDGLGKDHLDSRRYFEEAQRSLEGNHLYASVLTAAVGFEHALRNFGEKYLDIPKRHPLGEVLRSLEKLPVTGQPHVEMLRTLTKIRNGLVHGESCLSDLDAKDAETVVGGFMRAVGDLERAISPVSFERAAPRIFRHPANEKLKM